MDMESYKDVFVEETRENINILNKSLLEFEKDVQDLTPINELFRAAHTLKGMSATMGYDKFAGFTHVLEEVMDGIRGGSIQANLDVVNILFKSIDVLEDFLENIAHSNLDVSQHADSVKSEIQNIISGSTATASESLPVGSLPTTSPSVGNIESVSKIETDMEIDDFIVEEALSQGLNVYKIVVVIAKECAFKSVRAFMCVRNLSEKGDIVKSIPSSKEIEEGNFENIIELGFVTHMEEENLRELIMKIAEIQRVDIEKYEKKVFVPTIPGKIALDIKKSDAAAEEHERKKAVSSQSVRVNIGKIDALMNLVGELVIAKIRLDQIATEKQYEMLSDTVEEFDRVIDELQLEVTAVRMLPVSNIFDRYPRVVRDLASKAGKQVDVEISGGDIEIDRTVLEEINEPILHLIRNSIAHGIENPEKRELAGKPKKGVIRLDARRERNSVLIEVSDDGNGVVVDAIRKKVIAKGIMSDEKIKSMSDEDLVALIALPGFSTAEKVNAVSGRGVGVDVVKTKVEAFGGVFKIENFPGEGIKFILKLPLTLAIIQALLVKSSGGTYAIPVIHTVETLEMETTEIKTIQDKRVIVLREEVIPVFNLAELLGKKREDDGLVEIVIVDVRDKKIALEIQKVIGQQEVAIKSLGEFLKFTKGFSGVTILGDGKISLIVDIPALL